MDQDVLKYMSESTLVGGYVCYNNDAYYVVNINTSPGMQPFNGLPGGTHSTLDGTAYGGVILEDIVQSSYQAYQLNNNANGYKMPALSKVIDGQGTEGDVIFQNGILTPGFFNLPICDDIATAAQNVQNGSPGGDYWPCDAPSGYNSGGTNLVRVRRKKHFVQGVYRLTWTMKHVNDGCINVNDGNLCHPSSTSMSLHFSEISMIDLTEILSKQILRIKTQPTVLRPFMQISMAMTRRILMSFLAANLTLSGPGIMGISISEPTTACMTQLVQRYSTNVAPSQLRTRFQTLIMETNLELQAKDVASIPRLKRSIVDVILPSKGYHSDRSCVQMSAVILT